MAEQDIINRFMQDEISAEEMVRQLAALKPRGRDRVDVREEPLTASLVRAQAAIRRINAGR